MRRELASAATAAGACAALLLAGCGGGSQAGTGSARRRTVPGSASSARVHASLKAEEAAVHRQVLKSLHRISDRKYGTIPKDLRGKQKPPPEHILSARPGHPAEPIEGVTVRLHLDSGTALATVVGPYVPIKDQGSFHNYTTSHWDLTFSDVHGRVPIAKRLLTIIDEQGTVLSPQVTVRGAGRPPATVPHGRPFTLVLTARLSIGDGKVRYSPDGRLLAEWDFSAETD